MTTIPNFIPIIMQAKVITDYASMLTALDMERDEVPRRKAILYIEDAVRKIVKLYGEENP